MRTLALLPFEWSTKLVRAFWIVRKSASSKFSERRGKFAGVSRSRVKVCHFLQSSDQPLDDRNQTQFIQNGGQGIGKGSKLSLQLLGRVFAFLCEGGQIGSRMCRSRAQGSQLKVTNPMSRRDA